MLKKLKDQQTVDQSLEGVAYQQPTNKNIKVTPIARDATSGPLGGLGVNYGDHRVRSRKINRQADGLSRLLLVMASAAKPLR